MFRHVKRKIRFLFWSALIILGGVLIYYTGALLHPAWQGRKLDFCDADLAKYWGSGCGNLRAQNSIQFREIKIPSLNGYDLPGWFVPVQDNKKTAARGAVFLIHGGGSDRREEVKYVEYFINNYFDVYMMDMGCSGEAPCPVAGLSFGARESKDVLSIYFYLAKQYRTLIAMGTSVGATSILISLPAMPAVNAVIAENPMFSFQRFVMETPASPPFIPAWYKKLIIGATELRGVFDGLASSESSLKLVSSTPIFFIHSEKDALIPAQHSRDLFAMYGGPKSLWISPVGEHASVWNVDPKNYETRLTEFLRSQHVL